MIKTRGTMDEMIDDLQAFFYGKYVNYVDIGAYNGDFFKKIMESEKLPIREAHLVEPNIFSFNLLKQNLHDIENVKYYNMAVSSKNGSKLHLSNNKSMSKISKNGLEVSSVKLDTLIKSNIVDGHVSILKIDTEGYELEVLNGALKSLSKNNIDCIIIEAGFDKGNKQQTYYRDIEDLLKLNKYRSFKIYEQMFEWKEDSPFLRRINIVFFSEKFAKNHPYKITSELFDLKIREKEYEVSLNNKSKQLSTKNDEIDSLLNSIELNQKTIEELNNQKNVLSNDISINKSTLQNQMKAIESFKYELDLKNILIGKKVHDFNDLLTVKDDEINDLNRDMDFKNGLIEELTSDFTNLLTVKDNEINDLNRDMDFKNGLIEELTSDFTNLLTVKDNDILILNKSNEEANLIIEKLNKDLSKLKSEAKITFGKLKDAEDYNKKLEMSLKSRIKAHNEKIESINNYLSMRIGKVILENSKNIFSIFTIPFKIWQEKKAFDLRKKKGIKEIKVTPSKETVKKAISKDIVSKSNCDIINTYIPKNMKPITIKKDGGFLDIKCDCDYQINNGPLVTIIMPVFNASKYLDYAVKSLLNQTYTNLEIILVDDCSSDNSWDIMNKLSKEDNRIKLLRNKVNVGPYVSKNYALDISNGVYITGHDSDDWAHPQRIEEQVKFMELNPTIKASVSKKIRVDYDANVVYPKNISNTFGLAFISCIFNAKFLKNNLGYWDPVRFGADGEIMNRIKSFDEKCYIETDNFSMICLDREGSLTNDILFGISKTEGLSDSRRFYLKAYKDWHETLTLKGDFYLNFKNSKRYFTIDPIQEVKYKDIMLNKEK